DFTINFVQLSVSAKDSSGNLADNVPVSIFSQSSSGSTATITANGTTYTYASNGSGQASTDATGDPATFLVPQGLVFRPSDICTTFNDGNRVCNSAKVTASNDTSLEIDEPSTHMLTGTLTDQNGNPISGVFVELSSTTGNQTAQATTDVSGHYSVTAQS